MDAPASHYKGRGAVTNPRGRFESCDRQVEDPADGNPGLTQVHLDSTRSILAENDSPDVGFDVSINPYRGCEHGCVYCYARPTHEWLGMSAGLDFESKIVVKTHAGAHLRKALGRKDWVPKPIGFSGVTDPYQPLERDHRITRSCLEVLLEFGNPAVLITKNRLILRDLDLLERMANKGLVAVCISITTLDRGLQRLMEPRAVLPEGRLEAIRVLSRAGVPVGVNVAPVIPALTDHEIPRIVKEAGKAGARFGHFILLRLPFGVKDLFTRWLEVHFPARKERVLGRIRSTRGGKLNDPSFVSRMRGEGGFARQVADLFRISAAKAGFGTFPELNTGDFKRPAAQYSLFEV